MKSVETLLVEIPESSLKVERCAAFGGVYSLGLVTGVTDLDQHLPPANRKVLKSDLQRVIQRCALGLAGIGEVMSGATEALPAGSVANIGFLVADLGQLINESVERLEALEHIEARAAQAMDDNPGHSRCCDTGGTGCHVTPNEKPRNMANIAGPDTNS